MASTGYVIEIALRVKMNFEMLLKRHSTLGLISHTLLGRSGVCLCCRLGRQCRPRRIYLRPLAPPIPNACLYSQCIGCCMTVEIACEGWWISELQTRSTFSRALADSGSRGTWTWPISMSCTVSSTSCVSCVCCTVSSSVVCFPDELCCLWEGALVCPVHASCGPLVLAWLLCTAAFSSASSLLHLSLPL